MAPAGAALPRSYGHGPRACVSECTALVSFTKAVVVQKGFQPCLKEYSRKSVLKIIK